MNFTGFEAFKNGEITREELFNQWQVYVVQYNQAEIDPLFARMQAAKNEYFNAYLDLMEKKKEFSTEYGQAADITDQLNLGGVNSINVEPLHNPESFITANELNGLASIVNYGMRPFKGVTRA